MKRIALLLAAIALSSAVLAIDPIAGPSSVCEGSTITLTDATAGGTWSTSSTATGTISASGVLTGIAAGLVTVTYTVGGPYVTMDVTVNPTPIITSTLSPPTICDSTFFSYVPASAVPGATFSWARPGIPNLMNPPISGTGSLSELLRITAAFPVPVTYTYIATAGSCTSTATVTVNVNPRPALSNPAPVPLCDSTLFTFLPVSATAGTSFSWVRPFVAGVPMIGTSGTGSISETLDNGTNSILTVAYVYTLTAGGCSRTQSVLVTVNPTPRLSSPLEDTVCSGVNVGYLVGSDAIAPVAFSWSRPAVPGITNPAGSGVSGIDEILTNSTTGPVYVTYTYTLTITPGCTHVENVVMRVEAAADCENSVRESGKARLFSIFPNPATGAFNVLYEPIVKSDAKLTVTDAMGRRVVNTAIVPGVQTEIKLRPGFYVVTVSDGSGVHSAPVRVE